MMILLFKIKNTTGKTDLQELIKSAIWGSVNFEMQGCVGDVLKIQNKSSIEVRPEIHLWKSFPKSLTSQNGICTKRVYILSSTVSLH